MGHPILTGRSALVITGFIGFFYFLSTAHRGPWQEKFEMNKLAREQTKDFGPEFAAQFRPDSHPALRREQV